MQFQSIIVSECRLIKLRPCILFEKYIINILALQMASPGYRHCASCIGTLSFPVLCKYTMWQKKGTNFLLLAFLVFERNW